jgi:hypothetical protein
LKAGAEAKAVKADALSLADTTFIDTSSKENLFSVKKDVA